MDARLKKNKKPKIQPSSDGLNNYDGDWYEQLESEQKKQDYINQIKQGVVDRYEFEDEKNLYNPKKKLSWSDDDELKQYDDEINDWYKQLERKQNEQRLSDERFNSNLKLNRLAARSDHATKSACTII